MNVITHLHAVPNAPHGLHRDKFTYVAFSGNNYSTMFVKVIHLSVSCFDI